MTKKFENLTNLGKMLTELTGTEHRFAGCNGEYCCCNFSPFSYLRGYHTMKEITLYVEALINGLEFNKKD